MSESHILGQKGEELAVSHLVKKGYKILHRNWKSGRKELDIVAENDDYVVFVEVKTRSYDLNIPPDSPVKFEKEKSMIYAANSYIQKYNISKEARFDVIKIVTEGKNYKIEHIENAFYPTLR